MNNLGLMTKLSLSKLLTKKTSETIFAVGALVLILSVINYIVNNYGNSPTEIEFVSSNTQRNLSIKDAIEKGQTTYQFTTGFIPGIGDAANVKLETNYQDKVE